MLTPILLAASLQAAAPATPPRRLELPKEVLDCPNGDAGAGCPGPAVVPVPTERPCPELRGLGNFLCVALNASEAGRFAEAAEQFELAAEASRALAGNAPDPRADRLLAAAGNMWIAAKQPGKAALAIDRALAGGGLLADQRGQALLDRARAAEAQNDLKAARRFVKEAEAGVADDPYYWYFAAALAIREEDKAAAKAAVARALVLAPNDPTILFEAGHVAHLNGDLAEARRHWGRAAELDPSGRVGDSARRAIALLDAPAPAAASPTGGR